MKGKTARYILAALAGAAVLLGCTRTEPETVGAASLTARIAEEVPATRTSYDGYEGKFLWDEGDEIAVHIADGTAAGRYETFKVLPNDPAETASVPISTTSSMSRNGYAVYPASAAVAASYGSPTLKVSLPAEYDISDIVSGASSIKTSDFSPCPMVAINDPAVAPDELDFHHVGGLLRITLKGVKATTRKVRVTFDEYATGTFTVATPSAIPSASVEGPKITAPDESGRGKVVTFTLAESSLGATLAAGNIVLNVPVPCVTFNSVTVETLNAAGEAEAAKTFDEKPLVFNRHHGKKLAFGELALDFVLGTLPDATTEGLSDVTVTYPGGDGSFASSFVSYKTSDGGSTKTAVPFTLEYSEDGGATWSTTKPSWLSSAPAGGVHTGSTTGEALSVTASPQVNSAPDLHHDAMVAKGTRSGFDLSTLNVATGGTVFRTTANCYVVDRPGTYKFPLVYGNGVKNGSVNESAFRAKAGVDATDYRPDDGENNYLGSFKDHLDGNIYNGGDTQSSPYLTTHLNKDASDFTAVLLWQDAPGLVTVDPGISGSGENAYITFSVPAETITQGNALIAVLVDADGDSTPEIAWSWHVWVTEEDLTAVKEGSNSNFLAPVDIGWCEGKTETYAARTCQVRATQAGSGLTRTATLTQAAGDVSTGGNCPYYQWGRKDPLQASNGKGNTFKTYYPSSSAYSPAVADGPVSIGVAIRSPYTFCTNSSSPYDWCSTTYHNHWSSTIAGTGYGQNANANAKTKTVYDPSPVGFRVPAQDAWSGFDTSNFTWGAVGGDNGRTYGPSGLFLPASGIRLYSSGGLGNSTYGVGGDGFHWCSSPRPNTYSYAHNLSFSSGRLDPSNFSNRASGIPVRCVKE